MARQPHIANSELDHVMSPEVPDLMHCDNRREEDNQSRVEHLGETIVKLVQELLRHAKI